jgi:hypothetical protein
MKKTICILIGAAFLMSGFPAVWSSQEDVKVNASSSEAAEGLDLQAVGELFKESENLEAFEKALNDPEGGVNNLDLDENGEVDFVRVIEEVADNTHVIVLQVPLGEDEFQDVATIEIEKTGDESVDMQVHGNEVLYGVDCYYVPAVVGIPTWPIVVHLFRPHYLPYRSVYHWGYFPHWWRPWKPVAVHVYRTRAVRFTSRNTFVVRRSTVVLGAPRVQYVPHTSVLVKKKTTVIVKPAPARLVHQARVKKVR